MKRNASIATAILVPIALGYPDTDVDLSGTLVMTSRANAEYGFLGKLEDFQNEDQLQVISHGLMEAR